MNKTFSFFSRTSLDDDNRAIISKEKQNLGGEFNEQITRRLNLLVISEDLIHCLVSVGDLPIL